MYSGGRLSRASDTVINVGFLVCVIKSDEADNVALRVETSENQDISLASSSGSLFADHTKPYIVLRFGWHETEANYMNMLAVGWSADPSETDPGKLRPLDIILGKVIFEQASGGGGRVIARENSFDLTRRHDVFIKETESVSGQFRVCSSETDSKKVFISGGKLNTSKGRFLVSGAEFPDGGIPDTDARGRVDLIAVDANGEFKLILGTPAAEPAAPKYQSYKVLAEIQRGPRRSDVKGTDILQVADSTILGQVLAGDLPIGNGGGVLPDGAGDVESAIHYLAKRSIDLEDALNALAGVAQKIDETVQNHIANVFSGGNAVHGLRIETDTGFPLDID